MNVFNEKMLEDTLNSFNAIYAIYEKNVSCISQIDLVKIFQDIQCMIDDISNVKSLTSKDVLCKKLSELVVNTKCNVLKIKNVVDDMGKKFMAIRKKMPMPKSEVDKILKVFNFYDYAKNDTTEGNLLDYKYREHMLDENDKDESPVEHMPQVDENAKDNIFENDLDDPDISEDDIKPITIEQFENSADDLEHCAKASKDKDDNECKKSSGKPRCKKAQKEKKK